MIIHVHVACWNEEDMMPWFLSHYAPIADRIFCHDNGSTDGTAAIVRACPIAEIVPFETGGELRDDMLQQLKNHAWKDRGADWVVVVDTDELLHAPVCGLRPALARYEAAGVGVPAPVGFNMVADGLPRYAAGARLHQLVRRGLMDSGYSKRCVFDARAVLEINYQVGCHTCDPILRGASAPAPAEGLPPLYLLHFKYAVGLDAIRRRHAAVVGRTSEVNFRFGWGHHFWEPERTARDYERIRANARDLRFL